MNSLIKEEILLLLVKKVKPVINHVITEKREDTITEGKEAEIAQAIFNWESSCRREKDKTFIPCEETEVKQKKSDIKQKRLASGC